VVDMLNSPKLGEGLAGCPAVSRLHGGATVSGCALPGVAEWPVPRPGERTKAASRKRRKFPWRIAENASALPNLESSHPPRFTSAAFPSPRGQKTNHHHQTTTVSAARRREPIQWSLGPLFEPLIPSEIFLDRNRAQRGLTRLWCFLIPVRWCPRECAECIWDAGSRRSSARPARLGRPPQC